MIDKQAYQLIIDSSGIRKLISTVLAKAMHIWYGRIMRHKMLNRRYLVSGASVPEIKKPPSGCLAALIGAVIIQTVRVTADTFALVRARWRKYLKIFCHDPVRVSSQKYRRSNEVAYGRYPFWGKGDLR